MTISLARVSMVRGIVLSLLVMASSSTASTETVIERPTPTAPGFVGYVSDQLVVVFKPATAYELYSLPAQGGRARANLERVQYVLDRVAARSFEREFPTARQQSRGSLAPEMTGHYIVQLAPGMGLDEAKSELEKLADVDHIEKVGIHRFDLNPDDPYFKFGTATFPRDQWHYYYPYGISADVAWATERGNASVAVGIIDSGMRYFHNDLGGIDPPGPADDVTTGNVWVNPFDPPGGGDNEGNGFANDVIGWDFVSAALVGTVCRDPDCATTDNDPMDGEGHGTHVAGTVGAITNNGRDVAGIAGGWGEDPVAAGVRLIPVRIGYHACITTQTDPNCTDVPLPPNRIGGVVSMTWAAQAFNYLADLKARGINIAAVNSSWGSTNSGGISTAAANLQAQDVLIVCSAGNANNLVSAYLPTLAGVVCVGATDSLGANASFSNYGPLVDFAAPGVGVLSTYSPNQDDGLPDGDYVGVLSGTSMSTPHVVGAAAVLESYNPALTAAQKAALLIGHTKAFGPGYIAAKPLGSGILDLAAALAAAPAPTTGVGNPRVSVGPRIQLRASPNPMRGQSDLAIQARPGQRVDLRIVDASGRTVRAMSGMADAFGALHLRWDGRDTGGRRTQSGLYFVTASTVEGRATHKLAVLE